MEYDEIDQLFLAKHRKKIMNKQCAIACGISNMAISRFFSHDLVLSEEKQEKLKEYIDSIPEYATFRVQIKTRK